MTDAKDNGERLEQLANGRLGRLLLRYSWPALVSMTLNSLYTVVDRVFIGKYGSIDNPSLCQDILAGLSLSFPIFMIVTAVGVLVGMGSAALLSIKLGEGKMEEAERILGQNVALKLCISFFAPVIFIFAEELVGFAAPGEISSTAVAAGAGYMRTVIFSIVFSHLAFGLSACMRAEGAPKQSMTCMIIGFGINFMLDPIFVWSFQRISFLRDYFGPECAGLAGAAWATNIAMAVSCAWAFRYYLSGKSSVRLRLKNIRVHPAIAGRVLAIGAAPFLQQVTGSAVVWSLNASFSVWAGSDVEATRQIAVAGVWGTTFIVFLMPVMGIQQGLSPILGYSWGARRFDRVLGALKLGMKCTAAVCTGICAILMVFAYPLSWCFADSAAPDVIELSTHAQRVSNFMIWCIFLNVTATTYFQSIGRPIYAIGLSFLRQGLCLIPCIWILPAVFSENAVTAIWAALPVSDVIAFLATFPFIAREFAFLKRVTKRFNIGRDARASTQNIRKATSQ